MDSSVSSGRSGGLPAGRLHLRAVTRPFGRGVRRLRESDLVPALLLAALSVLIGVLQYSLPVVPLTSQVLPMIGASLVLSPRALPWVMGLILVVLVGVTAVSGVPLEDRRLGGVLVVFLIGVVILVFSVHRKSLGVAGLRGESMLVDLRDRIAHQAKLPPLPDDWYAEAVLRSAGGSSFAGDFVVASLSSDGRRLHVVVVDVSGKGEQAGSRSLLLSGSFGGLLGALPPEHFLPAANDYLLRQDWSEGFATAVHAAIDLSTGAFELRSAGHPPGVQLLAGSGRWAILEPEGPVLGLMPDAEFSVVGGTLHRGDALLLFTDGLVETSRRDISLGIDSLLGAADRLLRSGFENSARHLVDQVQSGDDRALLMLHRR